MPDHHRRYGLSMVIPSVRTALEIEGVALCLTSSFTNTISLQMVKNESSSSQYNLITAVVCFSSFAAAYQYHFVVCTSTVMFMHTVLLSSSFPDILLSSSRFFILDCQVTAAAGTD